MVIFRGSFLHFGGKIARSPVYFSPGVNPRHCSETSRCLKLSFLTMTVHVNVAIDTGALSQLPGEHIYYGTAKKKRPGYLVGNLVATNWPIEKALHAIGYNQIPTK